FTQVHTFTHAPADVEDAMGDPRFYEQLELPDVTAPEILGRTYRAGVIELTMRYVFTGHLDPIVHRVLGDDEISWTQTLSLDTTTHEGTLTIVPSVLSGKVNCRAELVLTPGETGAVGSTRTITG